MSVTGTPRFEQELTGPRPVGIREVAERAGVAMSSVSRVLSNHPDVSAVMRHRVLDAVAVLNYEPHMLAQSLRTGATMSIGFIAADIGNPLFAEIALGAETALRVDGYSMLLANALNDTDLALEQIRSMSQRRVDGLLISVNDEEDTAIKEALARLPFPVTLIDRTVDSLATSAVLSDHYSGIVAAADHLLKLGHRSIALVNGGPHVRPSRERARSLRAVARKVPGASISVRFGQFTAAHGEKATRDLLRLDRPPTAIIAGSNQLLVGVLRALRELNLAIPGDISVVTCDDVAMSEFLSPPLSTISRDARAMGGAAALLMLEQLRGEPGREILLPTGFRPTESCGRPALTPSTPTTAGS